MRRKHFGVRMMICFSATLFGLGGCGVPGAIVDGFFLGISDTVSITLSEFLLGQLGSGGE